MAWTSNLTKGYDSRMIQQKKAKTCKISSCRKCLEQDDQPCKGSTAIKKKTPLIAGFSFRTLDMQPDPLTDAPNSSSLPKCSFVQGEAQRSLTLAVARKKLSAI